MDSLKQLFSNHPPVEPPEIVAIKGYVWQTFGAEPKVSVTSKAIIVSVTSSSLANMLRLHIVKLQAAANTQKTILFRIT